MTDYKNLIEKEGKDPKFYIPIIYFMENRKSPVTIKEVANHFKISYNAAKPRLHKLVRWKIAEGLKRGYYCLTSDASAHTKIEKHTGKLFYLNGCIRVMGSSNGVWITIYNSKFGEFANNKYCKVIYIEQGKAIIRKSNEFAGSKIYLLLSKSVGISISRKLVPDQVVTKLSNKVIPLKIGIYLDEWGISVKDLFSTEAKEEGELAEELDKLGEIEKKNKFSDLKADILFTKKGKTVPVEITITNPKSTGRFKNSRRGGVKSSLIFERFYFFIKWNLIHKSPTVLIISQDWLKYSWVKKEEEFMKRFSCRIIFTDFKKGWAINAAQEINRLTDLSLTNNATRLTSE